VRSDVRNDRAVSAGGRDDWSNGGCDVTASYELSGQVQSCTDTVSLATAYTYAFDFPPRLSVEIQLTDSGFAGEGIGFAGVGIG
jgi:hypothetical protein